MSTIKDIHRGNKTITVGELRELLAPYGANAEVVFSVDVDPSSSIYHIESIETGLEGDPRAWIDLISR